MNAMTPASGSDKWQSGDAYERYMGRWSRQLAPRFLRWVDAPPGQRWLDVGCGTGALSAAIVDHCAPTAVTGVDPSAGFLATAAGLLPPTMVLHRAAADRMPLADAEVDVAVSALVLNFVPDAAAALREMARVTGDGGRVAACVWDYAGRMEMIRHYWDAAAQLGLLAPGQDQGERFPVCHPDALAAAFAQAGIRQVDVAAIEIEMHFADFDDYWQPFLGGQGPAPAHAMSLDESCRDRLRELLRQRLPAQRGPAIVLGARAWAGRGRVVR
jgi:SAM-dependent methyltransferase